jgi:predicted RNase H-like HicB family nuclease
MGAFLAEVLQVGASLAEVSAGLEEVLEMGTGLLLEADAGLEKVLGWALV